MDLQAIKGERGTIVSPGISRASDSHSCGVQEMITLLFSTSLQNSHGEIADKNSSVQADLSDRISRTRQESFAGLVIHHIHA